MVHLDIIEHSHLYLVKQYINSLYIKTKALCNSK